LARYTFGLSESDFWWITFGQLKAMQELRTQAQEREELLVGILACEIINWSFGAPKKPVRPSDLAWIIREDRGSESLFVLQTC
jgi:hypothetical protein